MGQAVTRNAGSRTVPFGPGLSYKQELVSFSLSMSMSPSAVRGQRVKNEKDKWTTVRTDVTLELGPDNQSNREFCSKQPGGQHVDSSPEVPMCAPLSRTSQRQPDVLPTDQRPGEHSYRG